MPAESSPIVSLERRAFVNLHRKRATSRLFEYPVLKIRPAYSGAVIVDLAVRSRGRHVIHVKPTPVETALLRLRPPRGWSASGAACEHFTFYFHAVLTPMYATSLAYSPDIASWHVLPTQSIFILRENENLSTFLKLHRSRSSTKSLHILTLSYAHGRTLAQREIKGQLCKAGRRETTR